MRESTLCGSDFEIKLRNELTQKAIAKECADWIRQKGKFKSNISKNHIPGFVNVASEQHYTYLPFDGFTTTDLGCDRGNNAFCFIHKLPAESLQSQMYLQAFNSLWNDSAKMQDVTEQVIDNISVAYRENAPEFIYFVTLYNIFNEFLEDISEDVLPDEAIGFKNSLIWNKLYDFQKDAVLAVINKLEKYNGCILADSVGLGKTFSALAVIKYYEKRNKSVLVLCPKKLANNWNTFKGNYVNNPIATQVLNMREEPSTASRVIAQYKNGVRFHVIEVGETWCKVYGSATGNIGYMMTKYLTLQGTESTQKTIQNGNTYVTFRSNPSKTNSSVYQRLYTGTPVTVLTPGDEWTQIRYNGQKGYVMTQFLK